MDNDCVNDGGDENCTSEDQGVTIEQSACVMNQSPRKTKFWTSYCDETLKPYCGQKFKTLDLAVRFYKKYAAAAGFDVRCSTGRRDRWREVSLKYLLCSREGKKTSSNIQSKIARDSEMESADPRRRTSNRVGCMAKTILKRASNGMYVVHNFVEEHTHCLCSDIGRRFLKGRRKLDLGQQALIAQCARANIGPSNTFRLCKEMCGSYADVGATSVEFHNFKRDLYAYLVEGDAQMLIDKFKKRSEMTPELTFEYDVDEQNHLRRVFWADAEAKQNYSCFDATYQTNRYSLVFVPFTGVDNHKNCVTFAAGLLTKEDIASYSWVLERFIETMGGAPSCIITDEDPTLKITIAETLPNTAHRFCSWHIMTKVSEKVGNVLAKDEVFQRRLNAIVWDETMGVKDFESRWTQLINDYNLSENSWFKKLFDMRPNWVSAFFTTVKMGGLLRTTSRFEAMNGVFGKITNRHASLMDFFSTLEGGIEAQRHKHDKLTAECEGSSPTLKTPLRIEKQVASLYTITVFYDVQTEICASCFTCHVRRRESIGATMLYKIEEGGGKRFEVKFQLSTEIAKCSCTLFERIGILCRHVFVVFKEAGIEAIPGHYIMGRWTRDAKKKSAPRNGHGDVTRDEAPQEGNYNASKALNDFYQCMALARGNPEEMREMCSVIEDPKIKLLERKDITKQQHSKDDAVQAFYGTPTPTAITILPPVTAKNKGTGKRFKSIREKVAEVSKKPKRLCRTCKQYIHHDSRNYLGLELGKENE